MQHLHLLISHLKRKEAKIVKRTVFEALKMAEDVGLKLQHVLDKLEKLD